MTNYASLLKRFCLGVLMATFPLLGGCDDTLTWQEEVKLLDGRVIVVTQKRRYEASTPIPREAWLMFKLPEFSNQEIVWHENLNAQVLNVHEGKLYIVGWPPTWREFDQYGKHRSPYLGFRFEDGEWKRIPFEEIPEAIYDINIWFENTPPNKSGHVTLTDKAKLLKDPGYMKHQKRIDPNYQSNF